MVDRLPQAVAAFLLCFLSAEELAAAAMVSSRLLELTELTAALILERLRRRMISPKLLTGARAPSLTLLNQLCRPLILIIGGKNQLDVGPVVQHNHHSLDLRTLRCLTLSNLVPSRQEFHVEWLAGYVYLLSNADENEEGVGDIVRVERFNPLLNEWEVAQPLPIKLKCAASAVLGGQLWVVGGFDMESRERSLDIHVLLDNPDGTKCWKVSEVKLNRARSKHACIVYKDELYVAGGYNGDHYYDNVEILNPITCQWREGPSMLRVRRLFSLLIVEGAICAVGGDLGPSTIERLDPATNTWSLLTAVRDGRKFGCAAAFGPRIYVFGGRDHSGKPLRTWDSFDVSTGVWASEEFPDDGRRSLPRDHLFRGRSITVPPVSLTWT